MLWWFKVVKKGGDKDLFLFYFYRKIKILLEKCSGGDKESKQLEKGSDGFGSLRWSWWLHTVR